MNRQPAPLTPCQALARTLGWITSIATMVVLGFIANRWPERFGSIAGGMGGVAIAILNDSWQMMSATNHSTGFQALPPARAMLHDMVSMAISLGGLVLVIFTGSGTADDGYDLQHALDDSQYGAAFTLRRLMNTAHWFLMAVMYAPLPG
ncbi:hypothetical protein LEL_08989 [Akanthomyces lecanii RCEF 1005]|uniref:Uncharacterized protein n=1 Tax=Akanthomyces lecanii RCEF 1005 TaxID=1081108 RepID=A0A162LK64_CORDF|nr:hypothetical protein LEL_08989 [Akanthomyces lecanii RCEF 1005]